MTFKQFINKINIDDVISNTLIRYDSLNNIYEENDNKEYIELLSQKIKEFTTDLFKAYYNQKFNFNDVIYLGNKNGAEFRQVCNQFILWYSANIQKLLNRIVVIAQRIKKEFNNKKDFNNAIISTIQNGFGGFSMENENDGTMNITKSYSNNNTYSQWIRQLQWDYKDWYFELEIDLVNKWMVVIYEY